MADLQPFFGKHEAAVHAELAALFHNGALAKLSGGIYILEDENGIQLLGLVRLASPAAGIILPQEDTTQSRAALPCPVRAAFADESGETKRRMEHLMAAAPRVECAEEEATRRLWVVNDILALDAFRADFAPRKLRLLSGQSAYEQALAKRECLRQKAAFSQEQEFIPMCLTAK